MTPPINSDLLSWALHYAARGWPVFPCRPRGKKPLIAGGFKSASKDPAQIRSWWSQWPQANIGIPTGSPTGIYALDIDAHKDGDASLSELEHQFGKLPDTPMSLTGGGGRHYLYRWTPGMVNSSGRLGPGLDTRGEGGYIIAPPSIHESGKVYEWEASSELDLPIADPPDWLTGKAKLNGHYLHPQQGNLSFVAGKVPHDEKDSAPVGQRNNSLASLLGQWVASGDDIVTVVRKAHAWNKQNPVPLDDHEVDLTTASIIKGHLDRHPTEAIEILQSPASSAPDDDADTEPEPLPERKPIPSHLLKPPGMIGQIAEWITLTSIYPQPELALATAIAFGGAIVGRKVCTNTDLRTNFYCMGVAASGAGKDHSRQAIKRICDAVGVTDRVLCGEDVSSDSAVIEAVYAIPSCLFLWDEIGHLLANCASKNAQVHSRGIPVALTKLFSSASTTLIGKEYADRKTRPRKDIVQPNACLYGTTVPGRLAAGLTPDELRDGFLGRMLIFHASNNDPPGRTPESRVVPNEIRAWVANWFKRESKPPHEDGNLVSAMSNQPLLVPTMPDAQRVFTEFSAMCREKRIPARVANFGHDALWSRTAEHASKLALLIASGIEFERPFITKSIAAYSCELAWFLTEELVNWTAECIGENEHHRMVNRILSIIRRHRSITMSKLINLTPFLSGKDRNAIVEDLANGGRVELDRVKTGGRPKVVVRFVGSEICEDR